MPILDSYGPRGECCSPDYCPETSEGSPLILGDTNGDAAQKVAALLSFNSLPRWCVAWVSGTDVTGLIATERLAVYVGPDYVPDSFS